MVWSWGAAPWAWASGEGHRATLRRMALPYGHARAGADAAAECPPKGGGLAASHRLSPDKGVLRHHRAACGVGVEMYSHENGCVLHACFEPVARSRTGVVGGHIWDCEDILEDSRIPNHSDGLAWWPRGETPGGAGPSKE